MLELSDLFDHVNIEDRPNSHIEIEVKFKIKPQYKLIAQYNGLLHYMREHYTETIEESTVHNYQNDIRSIETNGNIVVEKKIRLGDYHKYTNDYGFVISISEETPTILPKNSKITNTRQRHRHIFKFDDYELDLTEIGRDYEIELEYLGNYKNLDLVNLEKQILFIYQILNQSENFVTTNELTNLINETNKLYNVVGKNISKNILVKARNIKFVDLTFGGIVGNEIAYVVSHKADGLRHTLIVNYLGVWLVSSTSINLLVRNQDTKKSADKSVFIYECEVIDNLLMNLNGQDVVEKYCLAIYDCLVYMGENIMNKNLDERQSHIPYILDFKLDDIYMFMKDTNDLTLENFFAVMNKMFNEQKTLFFPQDGFIFTPKGKYNYHSDQLPINKRNLLDYPDVCKWKPPNRITIDFRVLNGDLLVYNMKTKKEEPFYGSFKYALSDISESFNESQYQNKIVESEYDLVCHIIRPLKIRHDKDGPNQLDIAEANWDDLHDYISEEDLKGDTLTLVKKYHNQIKNILYNSPTQYPPLDINLSPNYNLLDIGGGRGGDLGKWSKSKVNKVITVEPNDINLTELYERLKTYKVDVTAIHTIGEDTKQITSVVKKEVGQVDVVSLMLSLSFFWASEANLDALVNTIATNLKVNGYVVFLTINGDDLEKKLNNFYKVSYNDSSFTNYYGDKKDYGQFVRAEISGIVGKQWEFLVHLNDLTNKLENYGIVLRETRSATDELLLPEDAKAYTSLFTYGYYQKVKEVKTKANKKLPTIVYPAEEISLSEDEILPVLILGKHMVSIGSNDLLDAILKAFNEDYQNNVDRIVTKQAFREELASSIETNWSTYKNGYFQKKLLNQIKDILEGKEVNIDHTAIGLQYFFHSNEDILPLLNYVADFIDVDIFILDDDLKLIQSTFSCDQPKPDYILIKNDQKYDLIALEEEEGIRTLFNANELYKLKLPYYSLEEVLESNIKTLFGPTMPDLSTILNENDSVYKMIENTYMNIDLYVNALLKNIAKVYKIPTNEKIKNDIKKLFTKGVKDPVSAGGLESFLDQFKKIPIKTARVEERIDTIKEILTNTNFNVEGMKLLDIGAGKGEIIQAVKKYYDLPKTNVYAIDQKLPKIKDITTLTYADGKIPLTDKSIDVIMMFAVLHHIPPKPRLEILKEVQRILRPGGLVIIREHDDDKDPNFLKFIDLIHQFWYISENEKEDPLFLMAHDETIQLFKDINLNSVYYTAYQNTNPQHIYHEAFQSEYDDFPYKKYSMNLADVDKRFNNLKKYKFETIKMPYVIRNIPGTWYNNPKLKYNNLLIVNKESDYLNYNLISDYFIDECKVKAKRYDQELTPIKYWQQNKEYIKQQAQKLYGEVNAYTLREMIFKLSGEVTTFRETVAVGFIKMFNAKRILDPSSGWSNRLIAALSVGVEVYVGVDPNSCLHPKYKEIINHFPSKTRAIMIESPFETAVLPDITYDLILTSFPYFNLEVYTDEKTQSITNRDLNTWFDEFLILSMNKAWDKLEKNGKMVIIVNDIFNQANYVKLMVDVFTDIHDDCKYLGVISYTELVNGTPKNSQPSWIFSKIK